MDLTKVWRRILPCAAALSVCFWSLVTIASPPMSELIVPGDVATLAASLKNDPDLIYQYVHDHVRYVPVYAYQRGPVGTILDSEGSALDQAYLMEQLLISAGYSSSLVIGQISITAAQAAAWLGTDVNLTTAQTLLNNGGVPATISGSNLIVNHAWVQATISGTNYIFDPAYKPSTYTSSINIASALGSYAGVAYSASAIAAGGSVSSSSVRTQLTGYATNLENYIKTNYPNGAKVEDIIGGATIIPLSMPLTSLRQTSLPYQTGSTTVTATVPTSLQTTVTIAMPGVSQTFTADQLYGTDAYIRYPVGNIYPVLFANGNNYTSSTAGAVTLSLTLTYPSLSSTNTKTASVPIAADGFYEIVNGWGHMGRNQLENVRFNATSSPLAGMLAQSYGWIAQTALSSQLKDQLSGTETVFQGIIGIVGMAVPGSLIYQPYFDVPIFQTQTSGLSTSSGWSVEASSLETSGTAHAGMQDIIQQVRAIVPGTSALLNAVSVMSLAERGSGLQQITALPVTSSYTSIDQTMVANFVASGGRVFYAPYTLLSEGWSGYGFMLVDQNGATSEYISGDRIGISGSPASFLSPDRQGAQATSALDNATYSTNARWSAMDPRFYGGSGGGDGVNTTTGDALFTHADTHRGLVASKTSYISSSVNFSSPLFGLGWHSNYEITASYGDDPFHAMGHLGTALDAAAAITGLFVSEDLLLSDQTLTSGGTISATGNYYIAASYVQSWLSDQLKDNTVTITSGGQKTQFGKLPDGTYNSPIGSASQLTVGIGATLSLKDKFGATTLFHKLGATNVQENMQVAATITDRTGTVTTFSYTTSTSNILNEVYGRGAVIFTSWTSFYQYAEADDANGHGEIYALDAGSRIVQQIDNGSGHPVTFTYGAGSRLTSVFSPDNPATAAFTFVYDALGRVKQRESARGYFTNYYLAGSRVEIVDPLGNSSVIYKDEYNRPVRAIDAIGNLSTMTYDAQNRPLTKVAPEGNNVAYQYDAAGNVTQTTVTPKPGSGLSAITTSATYDPTWNLPLTETDPLGRVTTKTYSATNGNLLTVTSPTTTIPGGGTQTAVTQYTSYSSIGELRSVTAPDGMVTNYTYNLPFEVSSQVVDSAHLSLTTSHTFDTTGIRSTTDPNGNLTSFTNNGMIQISGISGSFSSWKDIDYTYTGKTEEINSSQGILTDFTYDVAGNLSTKVFGTHPATTSRTTTYTYDNDDRVSTITDPAGNVTTQLYDALSRPYKVTNAASATAYQYSYTANGKVATLTDAKGNVITYTYDGFDRLITTTYSDSSYTALTYDANGNVLTARNRLGDVTTFTYDELNRKVTMTPPVGSGDSTKTFIYDIANRQTSITDASGTFTYGYDTAGRMTSVQRPDGKTISYAYDNNGNKTQLTWPDGYYVTYAYDALNRMTTVMENGSTTLATYAYDATTQRRSSVTYGNSVSTTYGYDPFLEPSNIAHNFIGSPTNPTLSYSYNFDNDGRRTKTAIAPTDFTSPNFFWWPGTAASATSTYSVNNLNQYSSIVNSVSGTVTPTYDVKGNLTGDGANTLTWDYKNRLTGAANTSYTSSYTYDAFSRRLTKTVNGTLTNFLSDGNREIAEYDVSGTMLRRYVYGPSVDEPIVMITVSTGAKLYHHPDGLGSIVATSDGSGNVVDQRGYSPYGEGTPSSGTALGYTGRRYDAETGLYYYRARYYNPTLGRFLSPDPKHKKKDGSAGGDGATGGAGGPSAAIDSHKGDSTYVYAGNNPVNNTDPTGKDLWEQLVIFGGFNQYGAAPHQDGTDSSPSPFSGSPVNIGSITFCPTANGCVSVSPVDTSGGQPAEPTPTATQPTIAINSDGTSTASSGGQSVTFSTPTTSFIAVGYTSQIGGSVSDGVALAFSNGSAQVFSYSGNGLGTPDTSVSVVAGTQAGGLDSFSGPSISVSGSAGPVAFGVVANPQIIGGFAGGSFGWAPASATLQFVTTTALTPAIPYGAILQQIVSGLGPIEARFFNFNNFTH